MGDITSSPSTDGFPANPPLRRLDSLDVEANRVPHGLHDSSKVLSKALILKLAYESIGVIYGDVGTSPLYVYSSTFPNAPPRKDDVLGALSLVIYTLTLIPLIKYVFIVLQANDNGNGGTFALYSLICRNAKVSRLQNEQAEDEGVSGYRLPTLNNRQSKTGAAIKEALERSNIAKRVLLLLTLLGTCAVMGDGVLTPSISVLSAVDGIQTKIPSLTNDHVVLISVAILVVLFSVQRFGTEKVAFLFAPCVLLWFVFISFIGIFNIFKHDPSIFRAFSPFYIIKYFKSNGKQGWISLGGIVLAITAAYIGQGAYLLKHPEDVSQTFYKSIPGSLFWPMFVVAIGAAIIASQAMISAVFSIVEQSLALGCFPTVKVVHTSKKFAGQVYIPEVNWILMILCVVVTGVFKTTTYIGNAYGIAVLAVMLVTTFLLTLIMLMIWKTKMHHAMAFFGIFAFIEMIYFSANLYKFKEGGWLPLAFASILLLIMWVWHYVTCKKYMFESDNKVSMSSLASRLETDLRLNRVPGTGFMYTQLVQGVPPIFDLFVENLRALHSVLVFVSVKHLTVANVRNEDRFLVRRVGNKEYKMYRTVVRYGYLDPPIPHRDFEALLMESLIKFVRTESIDGFESLDQGHTEGSIENGDSVSFESGVLGGSLGDDAYDEPAAISPGKERKEEREREIAFLSRARDESVTYLLGNSVVEAAAASSFGNKFVVNVLFDLLQRISRRSRVALQIPHRNLLEVGITYTI